MLLFLREATASCAGHAFQLTAVKKVEKTANPSEVARNPSFNNIGTISAGSWGV
jgi:hypothetical protein